MYLLRKTVKTYADPMRERTLPNVTILSNILLQFTYNFGVMEK